MNIFERLFCKKKLQDISDEAIEAEMERRVEIKLHERHKIIYSNIKECLQYLNNCDAEFISTDVCCGKISIYYKTRVSYNTIHDMLIKDVKW